MTGPDAPRGPVVEVPPETEERVRKAELLISTVLRVGVLASLAVILVGTVLSFVRHPDYLSSPSALARLTHPGAAFPHTVAETESGLRELRGQAFVSLGLLLLILTPVVRVGVSVLVFVLQKDRLYTLITATVFAILLLSFVLGRAGG